MNLTEKLKIAMIKTSTNQQQLAEKTKQSKANLSNKLKNNNFKLSEYERLVNAMGCELEVSIVFPNGEKV